jgi:histidine triad (HIT) family protein
MDCVFCKIASGEILSKKVYEDDFVFAFYDLHPIAPIHILIIPKKHIASVNDFKEDDKDIMSSMFLAAKNIAQSLDFAEKGYKLLIRTGKDGGQEIPHLHMHLLAGGRLSDKIYLV